MRVRAAAAQLKAFGRGDGTVSWLRPAAGDKGVTEEEALSRLAKARAEKDKQKNTNQAEENK